MCKYASPLAVSVAMDILHIQGMWMPFSGFFLLGVLRLLLHCSYCSANTQIQTQTRPLKPSRKIANIRTTVSFFDGTYSNFECIFQCAVGKEFVDEAFPVWFVGEANERDEIRMPKSEGRIEWRNETNDLSNSTCTVVSQPGEELDFRDELLIGQSGSSSIALLSNTENQHILLTPTCHHLPNQAPSYS